MSKPGRIVGRTPASGKAATASQRAYYEQAKAIYLKLKKKYEPES